MDGKIALIHNGIIENYDVLKQELVKNGYIFKSATDTEVVVHLVDYIQKKENVWFGEALRLALNHVVGAYAIVAMSSDFPNRLVAARKSSPLVVGIGSDGAYYCASDATPIVEYTKKVVYLNDEEVAVIDLEKGLKIYDIADQQKTPFFQELVYFRDFDDVVSHVADLFVAFGYDSNDFSFAGLHLLDVRDDFFVRGSMGGNDNDRHVFIDQGNWTVLHFCSRIAFGMDVRNFFEFECAF